MIIIIIVIGNIDAISIYNEDVFNLNTMCTLKTIESKNNLLIILDKEVNDDGIIEEEIILDEIFITLNINYLITNKINNKLIEICKYHKCPIIYQNDKYNQF